MFGSKRQEAPEASPMLAVTTIAILLSQLLSAIQNLVLPPALHEMPYLDDGIAATQAATEIGRHDGQSASADDVSRNPKMPHQDTLTRYVLEIGEVIGQRAHAILAALSAGALTPGFAPTPPARGWTAMSLRTKILMLVAFILEAVFGSKMAQRLAGVDNYISVAVGLAVALLLTFSAIGIAGAIHRQELGLLRGRGAWIALGIAVLGIAFLALYAFGLGGAAKATPTEGGLTGGAPVGHQTVGQASSENWILVLVYAGLLILLLASVVLSHLIDLYDEDVARVDSDMASRKQVLSPLDQRKLALRLLMQCLVLNEQAKHRARGLMLAYVGGVRAELSAAVNAIWDSTELESAAIDDPAWVATIRMEIERLQQEIGRASGPGPSLRVVS